MAGSNKWWILISMCLLTAILNIDVAGINVAIPTIAREFHANLASMQWVINIYVLMSAAFQIFGGRLGDSFGYKKIYLIGCFIFIVGSLGAGLSPNESVLIFFRTVQGIALGIAYPVTIVITMNAFPQSQRGFAMGFIVTTMGVFLALGPILGGLFVHYLTWRWIFYINIPIGVLSFLLAWIFCSSKDSSEKKYIDYLGATLLVAGLTLFIIPLNQLQIWGFSSLKFWFFICSGLLLLFFLYLTSVRQSYPIFDFSLFKIRNFSINCFIRLIIQIIFVPILLFIPIYLQNIVGISAFASGVMMLLLTLAIAICSPLAGKWVDAVGDKTPNLLALTFFIFGSILLSLLSPTPSYVILVVSLICVGVATAITFVSTVTGSLSACAEKQQGVASGVVFTLAWLGAALGVTIMGSILEMSGTGFLDKSIRHLGLSLSNTQVAMAQKVSSGMLSYKALSSYFSKEQLYQICELSRQAFVHGFRVSMLTYSILAFLGLITALALRSIKPRSSGTPPPGI